MTNISVRFTTLLGHFLNFPIKTAAKVISAKIPSNCYGSAIQIEGEGIKAFRTKMPGRISVEIRPRKWEKNDHNIGAVFLQNVIYITSNLRGILFAFFLFLSFAEDTHCSSKIIQLNFWYFWNVYVQESYPIKNLDGKTKILVSNRATLELLIC